MGCYNPIVGARFSGVGNVGVVVSVVMALLAQPTLTEAREYQTLVGVTSNLVVVGGKVLFAQADGSLTVLDVQTGEVRARVQGDYSGRLTVADGAVIRWGDDEVSVLDQESLKERWRAEAFDLWLDGKVLFARLDGEIARMDLATGKVVWRRPFEQVHSFVVAKGRVLVFRDREQRWNAPKDAFDELGAYFAVLDAGDGTITSRVDYPISDDRIREAYFDGEHVYLARGSYENRVEELEVLDLEGATQGSVQPPEPEAGTNRVRWGRIGDFRVGELSFLRGGLVCRGSEPCRDGRVTEQRHPVRAAEGPSRSDDAGERIFGSGAAMVATRWQPNDLLRVRMGDDPPFEYRAPHLALDGASVSGAVASGDLAIIATTVGVVEGVSAKRGAVSWRYTFAPQWHHIPGCAFGPRSYTSELNDRDQTTIRQRDEALASVVGGGTLRSDPEATPRYPGLFMDRVTANATALLPLLVPVVVLGVRRFRRREWGPTAAARTFAFAGPTVLLVVLVSHIEPGLTGRALLAWLASVVCALFLGGLAKGGRRKAMRPLPVTVGFTVAGLVFLMFIGGL